MNEGNETRKRNIIKGIVIFFIYIVVVVILVKYISENADIIEKVKNASPSLIFIGLLTTIICIVLVALLDISCAKAYNIRLRLPDTIILTFLATAANIVLPFQLGSVIKATYYKKCMKLSYSKYISIVSGTIVVNLIVTYIVLVIDMIILSIKEKMDPFIIIVLLLAFILCIVFLLILIRYRERVIQIIPFKKYTQPVLRGFFDIIRNKRIMFECSLNYFVSMLLGGIRFVTIFIILGIDSGFVGGMLYYGLYTATSILPILPGNIGISETLVGAMNSIIGKQFSLGVNLILINRIYYYFVALLGALLLAIPAWLLYRQIEKGYHEK